MIVLAFLTPALASPPSPQIPRRPTIRYFIATAYSVEGTGASGKWSHPGTVAADRRVLPLNSRIRIYGAGRYSGDYTVEDTGGKVDGHHIDVYMPSHPAGDAQADFGEAMVVIAGVERKAHYLAMDLPQSDDCFVMASPITSTSWR